MIDYDLDVKDIRRLHELRHAVNVYDPKFVARELRVSERRITYLYDSDIHGSQEIKSLLKLPDAELRRRVEQIEEEEEDDNEDEILSEIELAKLRAWHLSSDLRDKRKNFAGIGTNKAKRRLNKLAKNNLYAKAIRTALEIEDKNICAKEEVGEYRQRKYKQKAQLILDLCSIFRETDWGWGIEKTNNYSASHIIYFEIPGYIEQISWHFTPEDEQQFPKYHREWDKIECASLRKLERATLKIFQENGL